jgi:putative flippase GtrA
MFLVGGLFSTRNAGVGGFTTALTGGTFWFLGWMPDALGAVTIGSVIGITVLYLLLARSQEGEV